MYYWFHFIEKGKSDKELQQPIQILSEKNSSVKFELRLPYNVVQTFTSYTSARCPCLSVYLSTYLIYQRFVFKISKSIFHELLSVPRLIQFIFHFTSCSLEFGNFYLFPFFGTLFTHLCIMRYLYITELRLHFICRH